MAFPCKTLSEVKLNIKQIINNLEKLCGCDTHDPGINNIKTNTELLLQQLENLPLENLKCKLKKRQKKKLYKKLQKVNQTKNSTLMKGLTDANTCSGSLHMETLGKPKEKLNHHFKSINECKRFLQIFELLEQLHVARGHNSSETYKFAMQLRQLKSIWNCLLQDKLQEQTPTDVTIQEQWNEVLFGPPERTYFHNKPDFRDFITKRQIWDSYIDCKFGSSIPIGWIVPQQNINDSWRPYNNIT